MLCLTNTGFVQFFPLGSHNVCCTPAFNFALFSDFLFCVLCLTNSGFVQRFPFGSRSLLHAFVVNNFMFCTLCLCNIGFVQYISLRLPSGLHFFIFICFIEFAFVMRALTALPNKLLFVQLFFPGLPSNLHS